MFLSFTSSFSYKIRNRRNKNIGQYLDTEVNDGHIRIVEEVQHVRLPKVQLLKLDVMDGGVGNGRTGQLHVIQCPLSHGLVLPQGT